MDHHGVLFLCLCLVTSQSRTVEASEETLLWMKRMEMVTRSRSLTSFAELIHGLECRLLNASFRGHNLTLQTNTIQTLAFKLGCDFTGLSLSSAALGRVPQAPAQHAMQFPAELTRDACRTHQRELRLICIYFSTTHFFQDGQSRVGTGPFLGASQKDINSSLLNNYVLGAQLGHGHVHNLSEPVNISFWHNQSLEGYMVTCVFWKEGASKQHWGVWSPEGCRTEQPSPSQVLCRCNHLTYFAVLMQLSPAPVPAELLAPLTYISLVGCSISIVASLLTVLLHFYARKQSDSITRIHMNLHASVLFLNVAFLLSPVLAMPPVPRSACTALAAILHYALLSCLTWMAIEGFNLYLLLGRVYNVYIRRYVLKLCAVGWGVPASLVLLLLAVKSSVYGPYVIPLSNSQGNSTGFQNMSMTPVPTHGLLGQASWQRTAAGQHHPPSLALDSQALSGAQPTPGSSPTTTLLRLLRLRHWFPQSVLAWHCQPSNTPNQRRECCRDWDTPGTGLRVCGGRGPGWGSRGTDSAAASCALGHLPFLVMRRF
nr:adhesion G-protein coupled receptor G5 isoform X1 [Vicugna pacos]XP_031536500.1 adhesion G-protein coupled receptor G5 isoform X1 [Vicugna pacos]